MNISPEIKKQAYEISKSAYLYYFDAIAFVAYFFIFIIWVYALYYFYKKLGFRAVKYKFFKKQIKGERNEYNNFK